MAHAPQTDEGDTRHGLIHVLDLARSFAEGALRQCRRHEIIEIAVEHA
jgi:hypothetical protein